MSYEVKKLKYLASINDETLPEDTDPDFEIRYVDIGNVSSSGEIDKIVSYHFGAAPSRARRKIRNGDVIISTVRTYLQAIAPIENPPENIVVSTGFAVVRPRLDQLAGIFCKYALRDTKFIDKVICRSVGVSYPAINSSDLGDIKIVAPPLKIQTKIANYLDRKTAEIDQLIGAKQRLLKLLDEKKRNLIARAVTRGLHPDVPLKDSGIPWHGKIPAHWKKTIVKRLFTFAKRQGYPDLEVLSVYREYGVIIKSSRSDNNNRTPEDLTKYQLVEPGDLVINKMKAWQGSMGISKYTGITSPDYVVYEKNHNEDGEFLHYLFRAPFMPNVYRMFSNGIRLSQWRLEPEHFENLILFLPPVEEQSAIIAVVKKQLRKLDALKSITEKTISLLQERRTALISAAVTGKLNEEILNAGIETQNDEPVPAQTGEHNLCLT